MRYLIILFIGIGIGAGGYWYVTEGRKDSRIREAETDLARGVGRVGEVIKEKVGEIRVEDVKDELTRTGRVVRQKAQQAGSAVSDATADVRITATIKTKFLSDRDLSQQEVKVSTKDGRVTLSGTANTHLDIVKAIKLAMDTDGVHEVSSEIQIRKAR